MPQHNDTSEVISSRRQLVESQLQQFAGHGSGQCIRPVQWATRSPVTFVWSDPRDPGSPPPSATCGRFAVGQMGWAKPFWLPGMAPSPAGGRRKGQQPQTPQIRHTGLPTKHKQVESLHQRLPSLQTLHEDSRLQKRQIPSSNLRQLIPNYFKFCPN